jgi:hypothetical protein
MRNVLLCCLLLMACTKEISHTCPFELCPYKGYSSFPGVINTGEKTVDTAAIGTDLWCIDKLHFDYPHASYDELEDLLFNQHQ